MNNGPDQPRPEPPPPPPPPRPGRRRLAILATSGIVILALVVVGLVYLLNGDDGETPTAGAGNGGSTSDEPAEDPTPDSTATEAPSEPKGWTVPGESGEPWDYSEAVWISDDALVHATNSFVSSTDRITGELLWSTPTPEIEGLEDTPINYCGASMNVQDGLVALAFGPTLGDGFTACALLQVFDTTTGEALWNAEIAEPHEFNGEYPEGISVEIIDGTVMAGWSVNFDITLVGYDVAEGTEQWRTAVSEDVFDAPRCDLDDLVAVDDSAVVTGVCDTSSGGIEKEIALTRIEPSTGSVTEARVVPHSDIGFSIGNLAILSPTPLVARVTNSDKFGEDGDTLIVFDESFQVTSVIAAADDNVLTGVVDSESNRVYPAIAVDGDTGTLVVTSAGDPGQEQPTTELAAYDLATGEPVWSQQFGDAVVRAPVGVAGGNLLAWVTEGDRGHRIATLDLATGEIVDAGSPLPEGETFYAGLPAVRQSSRYFFADGWVYAVRTKPGDSSSDMIAVPYGDL